MLTKNVCSSWTSIILQYIKTKKICCIPVHIRSGLVVSFLSTFVSPPFLSSPSRQAVLGRVHKRCQKWSLHCADYCSVTPAALHSFKSLQTSGTQCMNALMSHSSLCSRWKFKKKSATILLSVFSQKGHAYIWRTKTTPARTFSVCCVSSVLVSAEADGVLDSTKYMKNRLIVF